MDEQERQPDDARTDDAAQTDGERREEASSSGMPPWVKPVMFLAVVILMVVIARVFNLGQYVKAMEGWIDNLGVWAPVIFILIYIGSVVIMVPGSVPTVMAGAIFPNPWLAVVYVSIASTIGACLAFLIGRYFARDAVKKWVKGNRKFEKLDRLTREHGNIIVAITRLVPIFPFNLLNYGFSLTGVTFWTYALWTWLCMLPGTVLYVFGASAIKEAIEKGRPPWVLIAVVAVMAVIVALLVNHARKKLKEKEEGNGEEADDG